ncbi:MAG: hypothetical protein PVI42_23085, partial [Desulfobacterales bacterium]
TRATGPDASSNFPSHLPAIFIVRLPPHSQSWKRRIDISQTRPESSQALSNDPLLSRYISRWAQF